MYVILEDVNNTEKQREVILNHHAGKIKHRGIIETE